MLRKYFTVHFASLLRSPTREQREILFATPKNDREREELERLLREVGSTGKDDLRTASDTTRNDLLSVFGAEKFQRITESLSAEAMRSPEVFAMLLSRHDVTDAVSLRAIAARAGVTLATENAVGTPRDDAERLMSASVTPEQRETVIGSLIQENPRVTLVLLKGLTNNLQDFEEQMSSVERNLRDLPGSSLEALQHGEESGTQTETIERLTDEMMKQLGRANDATLRPAVRGRIENITRANRKRRSFGSRFWRKPADTSADDETSERTTYVESLKKQIYEMAELLRLQLQQRGIEGARQVKELARTQQKPNELAIENFVMRLHELEAPFAGQLDKSAFPKFRPNDPEYLKKIEEYLRAADDRALRLADAERALERAKTEWKESPLKRESVAQQERDSWASRCLPKIDRLLKSTTDKDSRDMLSKLRETASADSKHAYVINDQEMADAERWLDRLSELGQEEMQGMISTAETALTDAATRSEKDPKWLETAQNRLQAVTASLPSLTTHPVFSETKIGSESLSLRSDLESYLGQIGKNLKLLKVGAQGEGAKELRAEAEAKLTDVENAMIRLRQFMEHPPMTVLPQEEFERRFGPSKGTYENGTIFINQRRAQPQADTIEHEKGHAILDILTHRTKLLPNWLPALTEQLSDEETRLIEKQSRRWGIDFEHILKTFQKRYPDDSELARAKAEASYRRQLAEEYFVRRTFSEGNGSASKKDRDLFDRIGGALESASDEPAFARHEREEGYDFSNGNTPAQESEQTKEATQTSRLIENLGQAEMGLLNVREFLKAYSGSHPEIVDTVSHFLSTNQQQFRDLSQILQTGEFKGVKLQPPPELNEQYIKYVQDLLKRVNDASAEANDLEKLWSNPEDAKPKPKGFWDRLGVRFLSIYDMVKLAKDIKEDWMSQYKRKQERMVSETQRAYTDWISERLPTPWGRYLGGLKHYARRRENQAELEAVGKWEKAFENLDGEEIFELIGNGPTRDQLRGSIQLLCKRGLMDWSNEHLWGALERYSIYRMPRGPCSKSTFVRDQWLQKLVTQIWGDKEMYYHLRNQNDDAYNSEKKKFTALADTMSNVRGKASSELQDMLATWVECKKTNKKVPEKVNKHKYEELLHYAMRNGKMTMEQKFYYLVRGIKEGILSVERLQVLAGESSELLMKFPFLDYFYQRHNTLGEISDLADRLTENKGPEDSFKPGTKTTYFLRLILLRDMKARERMSKAISRVSHELDHEDIPYLATECDLTRMKELLGNFSGQRHKLTVEGSKNAYVGYSEKLKVYAHLAKLAKQGRAKFSAADTTDLANILGGYVLFDNQMKSAIPTGIKANLSDSAFQETVVANPNALTHQFRDPTRNFVWDLANRVGVTSDDLGVKDLKLNDFLANTDRDQRTLSEDKKKAVESATDQFARVFAEKVAANPNVLMDLLIRYEESFLDASSDGEGGTEITEEDFQKKYSGIARLY